jgi:hypothetical protein
MAPKRGGENDAPQTSVFEHSLWRGLVPFPLISEA